MIFGYGAGFARGVVEHGTDPALSLMGIAPKANDPSKKWQRVPVAGTFVREGTYDASSQSLKDFYAAYEEVKDQKAAVTRYAKTDGPERARARVLEDKDQRWFQRRDEILAGKKRLEDFGDEINAIYRAPLAKMTPQTKREALDKVYRGMVQTARIALGKRPLHTAAGSR
jgi:hypothetical protein